MNSKSAFTSTKILERIRQAPLNTVWTPVDCLNLGSRDAVERALQRMVIKNELRRIDRGLYDLPRINNLTEKQTVPEYQKVIEAIARRDQARLLIDGLTAAKDLGLTNAVPGKVVIHTDARLRPIQLDQLVLHFKLTAPSKLYWANRPAMRIVQSLYWLQDGLKKGSFIDEDIIQNKIIRVLKDPSKGTVVCEDLILGLHTLPSWMQNWIRNLLNRVEGGEKTLY